jgi:hypothetical protein
MSASTTTLFTLAAVLTITIVVGMFLCWKINHGAIVALTVVLPSVFTFFGMLIVASFERPPPLPESSYRTAIASALVIEYVMLLAVTALAKPTSEAEHPHPVGQAMVANFTMVIGLVLAFYFGASAYVETR